MISATAKSLAFRASLGTCLASLVVLIPPLCNSFSKNVQPLLVSAPIMAMFCAGSSQEETIMITLQTFIGTLVPICFEFATHWYNGYDLSINSWQAIMILLVASCIGAATLLLPFAENVKMYILVCLPTFIMELFKESSSPWYMSAEYLAVSSFGGLCVSIAFMLPIPGLQDVRALGQASSAFKDVANGCAQVLHEATEIFLSVGAGRAWRALARSKLSVLAKRLEEARVAVECHHYSPVEVLQCLTPGGRLAARAWRRRRGKAFHAASEVLRACYLLTELAAQAQGWNVEAAAVCQDAKAHLNEVAECAAALLRDVARTDFQHPLIAPESGERTASHDRKQQELHTAAENALASSRKVASELLKMHEYNEMEGNSQSKAEIAMAFTRVETFLFLMHSLVTDFLHTVSRGDDAPMQHVNQFDMDEEDPSPRSFYQTYRRAVSNSLLNPLLTSEKDAVDNIPGLQACRTRCCTFISDVLARPYVLAVSAYSTVRRRWRLPFKVALSFAPANFACVYLFDLDSTMACTVGVICTFGSDYDGGSLRKSILRGAGIAAGIAIGSMSEKLVRASKHIIHAYLVKPEGAANDVFASVESAAQVFLRVCIILCCVYFALLPQYTGGPYGYLGLIAALTALKFVVHADNSVPLHVRPLIEYNMYACLLVVVVEMGVLRVKASDLLKKRLAAALAGISAALASLLSQEGAHIAADTAITPQTARRALSDAKDMADAHRFKSEPMLSLWRTKTPPSSPKTLPDSSSEKQPAKSKKRVSEMRDLTPELKKHGVYDRYLKWREGYMRWRHGEALGSQGELTGVEQVPDKAEQEHNAAKTDGSSHAEVPRAGLQLEDLTQKLKDAGTYETYLKWRKGYLEWRKGGSAGSHGELTGVPADAGPQNREHPPRLAAIPENIGKSNEDSSCVQQLTAPIPESTENSIGESSCAQQLTRRRASDLYDLTPELKKHGVYPKYLRWREGYMRWRKGGALGCHGELIGSEQVVDELNQYKGTQRTDTRCTGSLKAAVSRPSSDLPGLQLEDLTQILKNAGTYETYLAWRKGYLDWRKGGSRGSHGELTDLLDVTRSQRSRRPSDSKRAWKTLEPPALSRNSSDPLRKVDSALQLALAFSPDDAEVVLDPIVDDISWPNSPQACFLQREDRCTGADSIMLDGDEPDFVKAFVEALDRANSIEAAPSINLEQMPALEKFYRQQSTSSLGFHRQQSTSSLNTTGGDNEKQLTVLHVQIDPIVTEGSCAAKPILVSLADVREILEESAQMLVRHEVADLAAQASERLDGEFFDSNAWLALADTIWEMWMQVNLLAHVSLRLRHEVNLTKLLGGDDAEQAASELVDSCSKALIKVLCIIDAGEAQDASEIAALDERLRNSSLKLASAVARRSVIKLTGDHVVTFKVLAGAAASALSMLLDKVAETLSWSAVLAGSSSVAAHSLGDT